MKTDQPQNKLIGNYIECKKTKQHTGTVFEEQFTIDVIVGMKNDISQHLP